MRYRDVLRFSLRGIRTSPLRSALSALSVAVGTGALLIIASLGLFGRTQIENGLARIGVSGLAVSTDEGGAGTPLSAALAERMAQAVPGIKAASPVRAVGGTVCACGIWCGRRYCVYRSVSRRVAKSCARIPRSRSAIRSGPPS